MATNRPPEPTAQRFAQTMTKLTTLVAPLLIAVLIPMSACDVADSTDGIELAITTQDLVFEGQLEANQVLRVPLEASADDRIIMWLRKLPNTNWEPRIELYRDGQRIQYGDPSGNADAHIPWQDNRIDDGFVLFTDGDYELRFINKSSFTGQFEFTVTCLDGPCLADPVEPSDPWPTLSNGALENEIRDLWNDTHSRRSYNQARLSLFRDVANENGTVEGVYTGLKVKTNGIPNNNVMNTEHTWPQSRGPSNNAARSDLNQLYPSKSQANSVRGNLFFCNVAQDITWSEGGSLRGDDTFGNRCFEPRDEHKGDVARALFYVAVIYRMNIGSNEEAVLRQWHNGDPPDAGAHTRNDIIEDIQGSRNVFIDYPNLPDRIDNF